MPLIKQLLNMHKFQFFASKQMTRPSYRCMLIARDCKHDTLCQGVT